MNALTIADCNALSMRRALASCINARPANSMHEQTLAAATMDILATGERDFSTNAPQVKERWIVAPHSGQTNWS